MSDLMREEFEAWWSSTQILGENKRTIAEKAWKASRECLVIELPKTAGLDRMASDMSMQEMREDNRFNRALDLAKKALTAAGVKYK